MRLFFVGNPLLWRAGWAIFGSAVSFVAVVSNPFSSPPIDLRPVAGDRFDYRGFIMQPYIFKPHTGQSVTALSTVMSEVFEYLSDQQCPTELMFKIRHSLDAVTFEWDAEQYWYSWLTLNADKITIQHIPIAKELFLAGFNFCQEELDNTLGYHS